MATAFWRQRRFTAKKVESVSHDLHTIVVGSGISGLTIAARLVQQGHRVLVLEKHYEGGGCLHCFVENEYEFDTGLHYTVVPEDLRKCLASFGVPENTFQCNGPTCRIVDGSTGWHTTRTRNNVDDLVAAFPEWGDAIVRFHAYMKKFVRAWRMYMRILDICYSWLPVSWCAYAAYMCTRVHHGVNMRTLATMSGNDVLTNAFPGSSNEAARLRFVFGIQTVVDFGSHLHELSGLALMLLEASFHVAGAWYPCGGPSAVAHMLTEYIESHGSAVLTSCACDQIVEEDGSVVGVAAKGAVIASENVVSTIGLRNTRNLCSTISADLSDLVRDVPQSRSHFYVFVGLKMEKSTLSELVDDPTCIIGHSVDTDVDCSRFEDSALLNEVPFLFVNFPPLRDSTWSDRHPSTCTCTLLVEVLRDVFKDPHEYSSMKSDLENRCMNMFFDHYESLRPYVDHVSSGSPNTAERFLNTVDGCSYGLAHDRTRFGRLVNRAYSSSTSVDGLFVSGQDVWTSGIPGAIRSSGLTHKAMRRAGRA